MTSTMPAAPQTSIILVPGFWLGAWAWDEVCTHLTAAGIRNVAMTLPGLDAQDPERTTRTVHDQADAIRSAIAEAGGDVVLVAHSGANAPVSLVLDRDPQRIRRVVWVDSGPLASGAAGAPGLPHTVVELPLPEFEALAQQASLEGLSSEQLDRFRARAITQPASAAREQLELSDDARYAIPTTVICCSMPSVQVLELARSGHPMFAELARLAEVELVDVPTGHWPMWSRPRELAEAIAAAATR